MSMLFSEGLMSLHFRRIDVTAVFRIFDVISMFRKIDVIAVSEGLMSWQFSSRRMVLQGPVSLQMPLQFLEGVA